MSKRFFDSETRPPRGGWNIVLSGIAFEAFSESQLIERIARWRVNNGTFIDEASISDEIWTQFCRREPTRCGERVPPTVVPGAPKGVEVVQAEITPALQGPPIWTFLNTLAARWTPGLHSYFLATCDAIFSILECPKCQQEWREQLAANPPEALQSRLAVCQWVNDRHNAVNEKTGKAFFPYWRMVNDFGAPLP